jgi:heme/copper-type cytochrome/quinol oxidase subunit 1
LHNVLYFGSWFGAQAGIYYWFPKITGRLLDERLGKLNFWLELVGGTLTFIPMYALGLMGLPRRVYTYSDLPGFGSLNQIQTIGAFIQAAAILIFLYNVWRTLHRGEPGGANPWDAATLERATTSTCCVRRSSAWHSGQVAAR